MSWSDLECSASDGRPVTLYEFSYGGKGYLYTNADKSIEIASKKWQALAISDKGLSAGSGNNLEIYMPADSHVAKLYRGLILSNPVQIKVHRYHDSDSAKEFKTIWVGKIQEIKREAIDRIKVLTVSVASSFSRAELRLTYGRTCPYSLYDHNCCVSKNEFSLKTIITHVTGSAITVKDIAGGDYFSGGFLSFDFDGVTELRGLKKQSQHEIGVMGGTYGLQVGKEVTLYAGCDRTVNTCEQKFNNLLNYGGQPHIPTASPYEISKFF